MKSFNELTHEELLSLTQEQIEAYCDIAVAQAGLTKSIVPNVELPKYLSNIDILCAPERDVTLYEIDGKWFPTYEIAQEYAIMLSKFMEKQVYTDYEYSVGSEYRYVNGQRRLSKETIGVEMFYSKEKFESIKQQLTELKNKKKSEEQKEEESVQTVINYEALEQVARQIKRTVKEALLLEDKISTVVSSYDKYFSITKEKEKTIETLFAVFGLVNDKEREMVRTKLSSK